MEDEKWTVVVRRRRGGASISRSFFSDVSLARRQRETRQALILQTEECDEALLLLRLQRSMDRLQQSAFFEKLLLQVQSSPVLDLLSKAASTVSSQDPASYQDNDAARHTQQKHAVRDENAERSTCEIAVPVENAERPTYEIAHGDGDATCLTTDGGTPSPDTSSCYTTLQTCERFHDISELNVSNSLTKTCNGRSCKTVECKSCVEVWKTISDTHMEDTFSLRVKTENCCLHVVLYGLGSIADSEISRCQLALILLLKQRCPWVGPIEVFDPVLTHSECNVIARMGCLPMATDEKGKRTVTSPTLFYMPHCEEWLYDNVLQANWVPRTLGQIVILGNSFQDYQDRWSFPVGRKSTPPIYLLNYQRIAEEVPLEATSSPDLLGFNNMSWHFYEPCSDLLKFDVDGKELVGLSRVSAAV